MSRILGWIKSHKLTFLLLLIILYFLYSKFSQPRIYPTANFLPTMESGVAMKTAPAMGRPIGGMPDFFPVQQEAPPTTDVDTRMVIANSYLSLLVNDVTQAQKMIIQTAQTAGGYMVESNLSNPQDAPTSTVVVRVPSATLTRTLQSFRTFAVKVITENLSGQDVTDEYVDNQARLDTLMKTKTKFEEIFDQAKEIHDILNVQREIINLQSQIDSIKGQQQYLEKNAQMAKIIVYLSTDEFALPYAPSETWRPGVIFKQAVRSVIGNMRKVGTTMIWLAVYSVIWIPLLILLYFLKKKGYLNFLR